jgi:hypothetical protein
MENAYIRSVTITIPHLYIAKNNMEIKNFISSNNLGNYLYYGNHALFEISTGTFNNLYSVWDNILSFINNLQYHAMLVFPSLPIELIKLKEIQLCFEIPVPEAIFCNTHGGFRKVENIFRSTDYHQFRRNTGCENEMSKGIQRSFISVYQFKDGSHVILTYSGKYKRYISNDFLKLNPLELVKCLILMGSVYLTHATNPEYLKISEGAIKYLPLDFQNLLNGANWYKMPFKVKNMTANFIGGLYNDIL